MDENHNGELTAKEFVDNFKSKFNLQVQETEMIRIIKNVDLSGDRNITFTEFLMTASNKQVLLSEPNLQQAFTFIDCDNDGFISRDDFRKFLNIKNEYFLGNLIEEADNDCDGGLKYDEFYNVMMKILRCL